MIDTRLVAQFLTMISIQSVFHRLVFLGLLAGTTAYSLFIPFEFAMAHPQRSAASIEKPDGNLEDTACGPRCAKFVLEHYGQDVELDEMLDELLPIDRSSGCSLSDLKSSLENRGIQCRIVKLKPSHVLDWEHPSIVHVDVEGRRMGHFIVVNSIDKDSNSIEIWNGLAGFERGSYDQLSTILSGYFLLTSPTPIDENKPFFRFNGWSYGPQILVLAVSLILILVSRRL